MLSITLFIVKIASIAQLIPNDPRYTSSLHVDDLQISYRHTDLEKVHKELQGCLDAIGEWAQQNGVRFSAKKTKAVKFQKENSNSIQIKPKLQINNIEIKYTDTMKYLGFTFDSRLKWD